MSLTENIATNPSPTAQIIQEPIVIPEPGPSALDQDMAAFIKETEKEFKSAALDELLAEPKVETSEAEPKGEPKAEVAPAETKAESIDTVVQRELGLRMREDKVSSFERREQELTSRIRELEQRQLPDDLLSDMRLRPHDTWAKMGLDPDEIIRMALAQKLEKLGQPVDPALRNKLDQSQTQRQIRDLEQKVISQERERASREYQAKVSDQAKAWVNTELAKTVPSIADVAKVAPDRIHAEIMTEIMNDAILRAKVDPNGALLTFDAAAKRVAARWDDYRKVLSPAPSGQTVQATPAQVQAEQKKTVTTVVKPPDRPLAPWLRKQSVDEQGLREALEEFKRIEATQK